ncbi:hypothetical protein ACIBI4_14820 [Streptomyces sp. NPDC050418]|uniref:hypothetical protein n=1 Tax=Streptomyces sp. NPDC050418 TaxID=3365612 RepID=UPI00379F6480
MGRTTLTRPATRRGRRIASLAAVGIALASVAAASPAAVGAPAGSPHTVKPTAVRKASVHGSARIAYAYSPDHTIRFTVHAEAAPFTRPMPGLDLPGLPTDAKGTVRISHYVPETGETGTSTARIDCMVTGGRTATLTAIVTKSNVQEVGRRIGISVQESRGAEPGRLGFGWDIVNFEPRETDDEGRAVQPPVGTCMAPAPFAPVIRGGFDVVHAGLPALPEAAPRG